MTASPRISLRASTWTAIALLATGCSGKAMSSGSSSTSMSGATSSGGSSASASTASSSSGSSGTSTAASSGSSGSSASASCASLANSLELVSLVPATLNASMSASTPGSSATVTLQARFANGLAAAGCPVSVSEAPGEHLVTLNNSVAVLGSDGTAEVTVTAGSSPGTARLFASLFAITADGGVAELEVDIPIGAPDAGPDLTDAILTEVSVVPSAIAIAGACGGASPPCSAVVTFQVLDANFSPLPGVIVSFAEAAGESLVTLPSASATSDASGHVSTTVQSGAVPGVAHITASLTTGASATASVSLAGNPAQLVLVSAYPSNFLLGIRGSGVSETGVLTLQVLDLNGTPVPGAVVNFTEAQPQLVTLNPLSEVSGTTGDVSLPFVTQSEPGVTSLTATTLIGGATFTQAIAVRGAKPSASGLYFQCDQKELPVYDVDENFSETTCTVRLSDRYGNRVGIPTSVYFATESGNITASATTAAFDSATPDIEGTAQVTFTTDFGAGGEPADVSPLPANPGQQPTPLPAEPSRPAQQGFANLELNPRDTLVTIIAMTQGEEAFTASYSSLADGGFGSEYAPGDPFVDEGSPYIDANDDNVYDEVRPGGEFEKFFCGSTPSGTCSGYSGPNGVWDANTTIWTATFVVFADAATPYLTPATNWQAGVLTNPSFELSSCDDGGLAPGASETVEIYAYDDFLNSLSGQSTLIPDLDSNGLSLSSQEAGLLGIGSVQDHLGSMSIYYGPVAASDGGLCNLANGPACVNAINFGSWGAGDVGSVTISNASTVPTCQMGTSLVESCGNFDFVVTANNSLISMAADAGTSVQTNGWSGGAVTASCQ